MALSDPKFELRMWRGPAWNCMTYWAARGCLRYDRADAARKLLEAALDATATQFERTGTIWEFYHPQLGDQNRCIARTKGAPALPRLPRAQPAVRHGRPLAEMWSGWRLNMSVLQCHTVLLIALTAACSLATCSADEPPRIPLWNGKAPIGDGQFQDAEAWITVHRPPKNNGAAIVICPGGGYGTLVKGPEGHGIAAWLNGHSITGVVLEYRLPAGRPQVPLLDAQRALEGCERMQRIGKSIQRVSESWVSQQVVTWRHRRDTL